jgi:hypothetical protein
LTAPGPYCCAAWPCEHRCACCCVLVHTAHAAGDVQAAVCWWRLHMLLAMCMLLCAGGYCPCCWRCAGCHVLVEQRDAALLQRRPLLVLRLQLLVLPLVPAHAAAGTARTLAGAEKRPFLLAGQRTSCCTGLAVAENAAGTAVAVQLPCCWLSAAAALRALLALPLRLLRNCPAAGSASAAHLQELLGLGAAVLVGQLLQHLVVDEELHEVPQQSHLRTAPRQVTSERRHWVRCCLLDDGSGTTQVARITDAPHPCLHTISDQARQDQIRRDHGMHQQCLTAWLRGMAKPGSSAKHSRWYTDGPSQRRAGSDQPQVIQQHPCEAAQAQIRRQHHRRPTSALRPPL